MAAQTITLYQYNQRQKNSKHKATEKGVQLDWEDCRSVTRQVRFKAGTREVTFMVPKVLTPGLSTRLADMLKFNIEMDQGFHKDEGATKYTQEEFVQGVWSLAGVTKPIDIEVSE